MSEDDIIEQWRVEPGSKFKLKDFDPGWEGDTDRPREERKQLALDVLTEDTTALTKAQELLYAADTWSVLLIFQAMDAAGKDSTIKHVMSGINPQGCQVYSFKHPSTEELDHNFLWRCMKVLPERGRIGIFNRSYYEEVLVVKVHPEFIRAQRVPDADPEKKKFWANRYKDINNFERHLARNGTAIVKFFLNVSKDEQRKRFLERLEDPAKNWKFSAADLPERQLWDEYMKAYEKMIGETSTEWAPWYVVPADHKWVTRALVSRIITRTIASLKLRFPELSKEEVEKLAEAKRRLENET